MKANKILFVDDDKEILENYELMFAARKEKDTQKNLMQLFGDASENPRDLNTNNEKTNYEVHTANQGELAIEKVKKALQENNPFKVAFVDMRMPPGIDGKETAKQLRVLDPDIEIVIVTAYSDHDLETIVNDVGCPDKLLYVKKPFDPAEIKQCALCLTTKWNEAKIKDDFLANISHELKTPLASIIGFSDILAETKGATPEIEQYAGIVKNNGKMMKFLVDDLITMVRLGRSDVTLYPSKVNINEILHEAIEMFRPMVNIKNEFDFVIDVSEKPIFVEVDKERFLQCFINLISNAIKYTPIGNANIYSRVTENGEVEVGFKDTGVGIAADDLNRIFEKFERLEKDHHAIPGLGLGLSICKKIIDLHDAKLTVESEINQGSHFKITFKEAS